MKSTGTISGINRSRYEKYDGQIRDHLDEIRTKSYHNPEEWKINAKWLLDKGKELEDDFLQGVAWNQIAQAVYVSGGKTEEIYDYLLKGIHCQQCAKDRVTLGSSYNMLGIIESLHGSQPQAIDFFLTSLSYRERSEDSRWFEGAIYANIAACYEAMGDYRTGLQYLEMSLPRLEEYPDNPTYVRNMTFAGTAMARLLLLEKKDLEKARRLYEKLRVLVDDSHEPDGYAELLLVCLQIWLACFRENTGEVKLHLEKFCYLLKKSKLVDNISMEALATVRLLMRVGDNEDAQALSNLILNSVDRLAPGMQVHFWQCEVEILRRFGKTEECREAAYRFFEAYSQNELENTGSRLFSANIRIEVERIRKENEMLSIRAVTDELTGLPNRYHMNDHAEEIFQRARENETSLALEILDVDYFKQINDTFGHLEGDRYLRAVAHELMKMTKSNENIYCARYGGDEFMILYENMTDEEVLKLAEDLKARVEALALPNPRSEVSDIVTISQGIRNTIPSRSNRLWDYLSTADTAMYRVKKRNRGGIMLVHYRNDPEIN